MDDLGDACAQVARRARHVSIDEAAIAAYAPAVVHPGMTESASDGASLDERAAASLTLNAINFGSGWFPTLRKRGGLSGYNTIAAAWREHPTPAAHDLTELDQATVDRPSTGREPPGDGRRGRSAPVAPRAGARL